MAATGNPAAYLTRLKRSSSTAATSWPPETSAAEALPWYALMPRMCMSALVVREVLCSVRSLADRKPDKNPNDPSGERPVGRRRPGSSKCQRLRACRIGFEEWRLGVGVDQPNPAPVEIIEQRTRVHAGDFPGPHDLRAVDVRTVVNPFAPWIVFQGVAHNHQVLARGAFQLFFELFAILQSGRGSGSNHDHLRPDRRQEHGTQNHRAREAYADRPPLQFPPANVSRPLRREGVKSCRQRRHVMQVEPGSQREGQKDKTDLRAEKDKPS